MPLKVLACTVGGVVAFTVTFVSPLQFINAIRAIVFTVAGKVSSVSPEFTKAIASISSTLFKVTDVRLVVPKQALAPILITLLKFTEVTAKFALKRPSPTAVAFVGIVIAPLAVAPAFSVTTPLPSTTKISFLAFTVTAIAIVLF